jgi:hypothetical protein
MKQEILPDDAPVHKQSGTVCSIHGTVIAELEL